jgi:HEPN family protein
MEFNDEFVIDFAKRTRLNLEAIETAKDNGEDVREFTQLINSLLGLLIFPYEHSSCTIQPTPLQALVNDHGWPEIKTSKGKLRENTLGELARSMRHSFAHCLVEFLSDDKGNVGSVKLWNGTQPNPSWETVISANSLRLFVLKFSDLIENQNTMAGDES